jgi:hypothetical protein
MKEYLDLTNHPLRYAFKPQKKEKRDASEEVKALKVLCEANKTNSINLKDAFM